MGFENWDWRRAMQERVRQKFLAMFPAESIVIKANDGEARCTICWKRESEWSEFHGHTLCA